ncbi:MAG: hypothetical protein EOP04_02080 [Proteobacteria bacterium]|nr:MAG: hypothetical protein EOP04_02080 [Pseudomonadota bacterium]
MKDVAVLLITFIVLLFDCTSAKVFSDTVKRAEPLDSKCLNFDCVNYSKDTLVLKERISKSYYLERHIDLKNGKIKIIHIKNSGVSIKLEKGSIPLSILREIEDAIEWQYDNNRVEIIQETCTLARRPRFEALYVFGKSRSLKMMNESSALDNCSLLPVLPASNFSDVKRRINLEILKAKR